MKNWLRVTICIALVVSVLAMSLSVFADDVEPTATPYPGTDEHPLMQNNVDDIAFVLWQLLDSWGIKVTYGNITNYTSEIENQITNWVWEFLDDQPSVETIASWVLDWWFGTDFWGNLVVNDTLLEDAEAFAGWLENKYGLTDNSNIVVNPVNTLGGYQLYDFNRFYSGNWIYPFVSDQETYYNYVAMEVDTQDTDLIGWFQACITDYPYEETENGFTWWIYVIGEKNISGTKTLVWKALSFDDVSITRGTSQTFADRFTVGDNISWKEYDSYRLRYYYTDDDYWGNYFVIDGNHLRGTTQYVYQFLNSAEVEQVGDIKVITGIIDFPTDNPDYTPGDGMTVIDGKPDYSIVTIPDSISVDNLPAVVSTRKIENPHLEEAYRPIQGLITYAKDGVEVCTALLYELPDELVYLWYGLIASIIIWGMIKLMREH